MKFTLTILAASVSMLILGGCSDSDTSTGPINIEPSESTLKRIDNSDEFYAALKEGLLKTAANSSYNRDFPTALQVDEEGAGTTGSSTGGTTGDGGLPTADNNDTATSSGVSGASLTGGDTVTGTNVQEVGIDEQDRVKADNSYLYVLTAANDPYAGLAAEFVDSGTFGTTSTTSEIGVADTSFYEPRPVVNKLRILSFQPDAPDATAVAEMTLDLKGRNAQGMYLHPASNGQNAIVTSTGYESYASRWDQPYWFSNQVSGISRVDVSDPGNAKIAEDFVIDGRIISSRRIGSNLIVASRYYPTIQGIEPYGVPEEEYIAAVEAVDLSTLLPNYSKLGTDEKTPLVDPAACFVAPKAGQESYYVPNIITLSVIDLNTMDLTNSTCFMGSSETLYASPHAVYLATTRWDNSANIEVDSDNGAVPSVGYIDPRVNTDIHEFVISGSSLNYNGSGVVKGHLGWSELRKPFRMSEKDGYLRVATYSDRFQPDISPINLTVLKSNGSGKLETISELPNDSRPAHIGKPGEQLYASRFVGNKAYLVTFRQTDPLYVIDLADPADPILAGELKIDGYSDYLQPISENYLLGIGKDAVAANNGFGDGRGAVVQGIKLALFDVSNAAVPTEVQSLIIGQRGSQSNALDDHRAITIQAATGQHPTRVALSITVAGEVQPATRPNPEQAWEWYGTQYTGLHGFDVRTGTDAGISLAGVMKPAGNSNPWWYGFNDRSVIYNDSVYYIRGDEVFAAPWTQMDNPVGPR
ncbi:MAG: beta-propeller domain-containing protein [Granulosicoccaceae bacterium]